MPRKVRQLISDLKLAGFFLDRQKGSHRQFKHPEWPGIITISGGEGDDAQRYQGEAGGPGHCTSRQKVI
ncbi:type II toxin-antitoxin system HicA family toxin [Prosthecobacter sp.]|jgi:predicted RNA binding protein YcfA (HicA-like mRNA interferase family)|uniref:type II toxin-antitoxin system HicA family toxin n=1 Tax=Prosthecobacter sp. TaxID=1965333 RepID=UPI00378425A3